jgi:hypothetical protein
MRRKALIFVSALSLLLCVAMVVLWVRSYRHCEQLMHRNPDLMKDPTMFRVATCRGSTYFCVCEMSGDAAQRSLGVVSDGTRGYFQMTPTWRYSWEYRNGPKPFIPLTTRLGFGLNKYPLVNVEPPLVGKMGDSVNATIRNGVETRCTMPMCSLVLLFAATPAASLANRWRRARRSCRGACPECSYDLTGNTSGTCPECGTAIPTRAKTPETESPRPA